MPDPVTVDHGSLTVTSNTTSEADLLAELQRDDAPAAAPPSEPSEASAPAEPSAPARDEQGRFVKRDPVAMPPSDTPQPADESSAASPAEPAPGEGLPRHDPIARMKKALAQKAEAERRAAALEAEVQRLRQPLPAPAATNGHGEPQFEQFADQPDPYTAFMQAWARWDHARQLDERFARYDAERTAKAQQATFESRIQEGSKQYPDWQDALTEADTLGLQVSAVMRQAITESPRAADLVHFLATHPEECTQLAEESIQTPVAAASVMRRLLESQVGPPAAASHGAGTAARPVVSTAKPPVKPVGSSPVVSDAPPGDDAPLAEHARYWNRKLKVPGTK